MYWQGVRSTLRLEVPVCIGGELVVSKDYVRTLVGMANEKMVENVVRINRFFDSLKAELLASSSQAPAT